MFCLKCDVDHRYLHSFPTRRSSDLILRQRLFEQFDTVILTSATLTVGGRFDYIRQRLGIDHAKERALPPEFDYRSEEHTSELQSLTNLVCRLLLEKKKQNAQQIRVM